jgi:beta-propeller uncharacterized protein DUF5122
MRRIFSTKPKSAASNQRYVRPRLEALEDRFLLSGSPGPSYTKIVTPVQVYAQKELVLPDGEILVGGSVYMNGLVPVDYSGSSYVGGVERTSAIELALYNPDGSLDTAFGNGGIVFFQPNVSDYFANFALQSDGKIVVVGTEISSGAGSLQATPLTIS